MINGIPDWKGSDKDSNDELIAEQNGAEAYGVTRSASKSNVAIASKLTAKGCKCVVFLLLKQQKAKDTQNFYFFFTKGTPCYYYYYYYYYY